MNIRLEDLTEPDCVNYIFKYMALREDYYEEFAWRVSHKEPLGGHVTNIDSNYSFDSSFDSELMALFSAEFGAETLLDFGYDDNSPTPIYMLTAEQQKNLLLTSPPRPKPTETEDEFFETGEAHLARGELELARIAYEKALTWNPTGVGTLGRLGDIHVALGDHDKAIAYFRRIERSANNLPEWLHIGLANAFQAKGDNEQALKHLRKALNIAPDNANVRARLAEIEA